MRLADLVGMVSHRPFPGLPGKVGMAREPRALPEGGQRPGVRSWRFGLGGWFVCLQGSLLPNPAAVCAW